jgi:hypothetical protein
MYCRATHCRNRLPPGKINQGFNSLLIKRQVIKRASRAPADIRVGVVESFQKFRTFQRF